MRNILSVALALVGFAGWSMAASGQVPRPVARSAGTPGHTQVASLPYTAEFKTTTVRTLANGSTITRETTEIMARDSQGRLMQSTTGTPLFEGQPVHTMVTVHDPVARTHGSWMVPGERATVANWPAPDAARTSCAAATPAAPRQTEQMQRDKPTTEDLGTQTFQGLEASGHRSTWTIPAGAIGNSEQLVRTTEAWFSTTPGLSGINVRQVSDEPQTGLSTRELVRFTQGEPDAALFQPPQDYEVVIQETRDEVRCPQ